MDHAPDDSRSAADALNELLTHAVRAALRKQDFESFAAWTADNIGYYLNVPLGNSAEDIAQHGAMARSFAAMLWSALPLPVNDFKPQPLPEPGRNDPCLCGSGRKYKQCCQRLSPSMRLRPEQLWPFVLRELPSGQRKAALAAGHVPFPALLSLAVEWAEDDEPENIVELLEPVFEGPLKHVGEDAEAALDLLCNAYLELGDEDSRRALVEKVVYRAPRSRLRVGALQRLATLEMDAGNPQKSWEAFRRAQQDDPEDLVMSALEVQLLIAEGRTEEARERAKFWLRRIEREKDPQVQELRNLLRSFAEDPTAAQATIAMPQLGEAGEALMACIQAASQRPLPEYRLRALASASGDAADLVHNLRNMGLPGEAIEEALKEMLDADEQAPETDASQDESEDPFASAAEDEGEEELQDELEEEFEDGLLEASDEEYTEDSADELAADDQSHGWLEAPEHIVGLQERWRDVFPMGKPYSTQELPVDTETDIWEERISRRWIEFLRRNPASLDSLDIIDDVVTAVYAADEDAAQLGLLNVLIEPLVTRAANIIDRAIAAGDAGVKYLLWNFAPNRPALRSLVRRLDVLFRLPTKDQALDAAYRILQLNPNDNHGLRSMLVNAALKSGANERALEVAQRYPNDMFPDTRLGEVLALLRLGRDTEARERAAVAARDLSAIVQALLKDPRKASAERRSSSSWEEDAANDYREEMLPAWQATPQALEKLAQMSVPHMSGRA